MKDPCRMARKLLPPQELMTCSCVPPKPGKKGRPAADVEKMNYLLGKLINYLCTKLMHNVHR